MRRQACLALRAGLATVVLVGATACTGGDETEAEPEAEAEPEPTSQGARHVERGGESEGLPRLSREPAPIQVRVRQVWGQWPGVEARRTDVLARQAGRAVTGWMSASTARDALAGFTPGARAEARRRPVVVSHAVARRGPLDVVPTRRLVQLVAYAPRGTAVGATASVQLVLLGLRSDDSRVETAVTGDLYLTRGGGAGGGAWQVFGYDLERRTGKPGAVVRSLPADGEKKKDAKDGRDRKTQRGDRR